MTKTPPLTTAQVAAMLGVSIKTVQRLARGGEIPGAQKLPGRNGPFIFDPDGLAWYQRTQAQAS